MTNPSAVDCATCGRRIWVSDRFCAACGTPTALTVAGEIDPDSLRPADAKQGKASRRESLLGMGVLVSILGLVAMMVLLGSRDASEPAADSAAPPGEATPDPSEEPAPTLSPAPTATEEPAVRPASEVAAEQEPTDATPTPDPLVQALQGFIGGADLGTGWMVVFNQRRNLLAINLESLETVELETETSALAFGSGVYALASGVVVRQPVSGSVRLFTPWASDSVETYELAADVIGADSVLGLFIDDSVGPVAITVPEFGVFGDDFGVRAVALRSGESKNVELADPFLSLIPLLVRQGYGIEPAATAFVADDGNSVFRWSWADGWSNFAEGRLSRSFSNSAIVTRCQDPARCEVRLIDLDGTNVDGTAVAPVSAEVLLNGGFPPVSEAVGLQSGQLATVLLGPDEPMIAIVDLESGRDDVLIEMSGAPASMTFSPNGRYLLVHNGRDFRAVEIATGAETIIGDGSRDVPPGVVFLDELER